MFDECLKECHAEEGDAGLDGGEDVAVARQLVVPSLALPPRQFGLHAF